METLIIPGAAISPAQIARLSHPLAAANHRQWIVWERWVLRDPAKLSPDAAEDIIASALANGLDEILERNARAVINLVMRTVGEFAYPPTLQVIADRKLDQFSGWVRYAVTKTADDRTRWLLQCRTPFLYLSPAMQKSDYDEAEKDLVAIADASGLILAEDTPSMHPQTPRHLRRLRRRHSIGMHGAYVCYTEKPWAGVCLGCHRDWAVVPPGR